MTETEKVNDMPALYEGEKIYSARFVVCVVGFAFSVGIIAGALLAIALGS
jgi:hypothetical protein